MVGVGVGLSVCLWVCTQDGGIQNLDTKGSPCSQF